MTTEDFLSENQDHIDEIYQRYATAMQRRYRDPLAPERFISHFFNGESLDETYIYGDFKEGFVL
ncbi:hypothetical protein FACS189428_1820 [Clostridia bacterium]|nr:hypothetical protein FACS189428_1820 [Clostridia bacterium]